MVAGFPYGNDSFGRKKAEMIDDDHHHCPAQKFGKRDQVEVAVFGHWWRSSGGRHPSMKVFDLSMKRYL
jgi:hypothetical protein